MPDTILYTTSSAYKDVTNVNSVLESQFEEFIYASSENDGAEYPSGSSAPSLDEEHSGGDDEAPTSVEIAQDNGSWDSSSYKTLHKTTQASATGLVAPNKSYESTT